MKRNLSVLCLAALIGSNAQPAPSEEKYGKGYDYPAGWTMGQDYITMNRVGGFSGKRIEKRGTEKTLISPSENPISVEKQLTDQWNGRFNPNKLLETNPIMSLILIKDNKIIYESYQYETSSESTFNSESMAKTLTSLTIGVLLGEGKINNLDDSLSKYVPEFIGTKFGDNSIKQLLQMKCGLKDPTVGKNGAPYANKKYGTTGAEGPDAVNLYDYFKSVPTTFFKTYQYDSRCTDALSMVITKITGKLLAEVFEEKIWRNIGSEKPAYWAKATKTDITSGANQFWASPADWSKIAILLANKGKINDLQVIPEAYMNAMIEDTVSRSGGGSYGYQVFLTSSGGAVWANGYLGQKIYFDNTTKSAMLTFSVDEHNGDVLDFWEWFRKSK